MLVIDHMPVSPPPHRPVGRLHTFRLYFYIHAWSNEREQRERGRGKEQRDGREWWKRTGKASLMFPVKIFSPLPHDASPGPATTHTVQPCTRTYMHGAGVLSHPFVPKILPKGARGSQRPYLIILNFLFVPLYDSWLVNNLGEGGFGVTL